MNKKILFGVPPKDHIRLAFDEVEGLRQLGYQCKTVTYGQNNPNLGKLKKLSATGINALKILLVIYRFSPDIIYLNSRFDPMGSLRDVISVFIFKTFYFKKVKIVIKSHGSDAAIVLTNDILFKKIVVPYLTKHVYRWLLLSREGKHEIQLHSSVLAEKIEIIPNIIDPSRSVSSSEFKDRYHLNNGKFRFLFAGRMVKKKGIFTILESIATLPFKGKCTFLFVGDGPELHALKCRAKELKISEHISFTGFIPDEECDQFYANTDALIYPTFDSEGFPMALFKAVACGLPVITTQIRAAKDYLKSPENTLWADGKSVASVSAAMTRIFESECLRNSMSKNNKELGREFSREQICLKLHKIFS